MGEYIEKKVEEHDVEIKNLKEKTNELEKKQLRSDILYEKLIESNDKMSRTMDDVSKTMTEIQYSLKTTQNDVAELKENAEKNCIDIRDPIRNGILDGLSDRTKIVLSGGGMVILFETIKYIVDNLDKFSK